MMSATEILEQIRRLPENERRKVAGQIVEEFGNPGDRLSLEQIEEFDRRAERLSKNPENGIPWEQVLVELPERLKNRKCAAK
ncbi:MAG TPA: addiction module protein [Verrucomicrobiae bacterium]|jgi:putative addiction module component (TIGR02574 family)|nr:addiction module protein [Verrucomicrobiae bacterium]